MTENLGELTTTLMAGVEEWKAQRAALVELEDNIRQVRDQLGSAGIHITLDGFDDAAGNTSRVAALIPPNSLGDRETAEDVPEVFDEGDIIDLSVPQPEGDKRSATQIRAEALASPEPEDAAAFKTDIDNSFARAVTAGFQASTLLSERAPFTETQEGKVQTRGFGS